MCDMSHRPGRPLDRWLCLAHCDLASYRSDISVIRRKIETDDAPVTTLVCAVRHVFITERRLPGQPPGRRREVLRDAECGRWRVLIASFLMQIGTIRPSRRRAARRRARPSPARLPDL